MRRLCCHHLLVVVLLIVGFVDFSATASERTDLKDVTEDTIAGPKEECSETKSDILFVIDASTSITMEKFDAMRSFIMAIIKTEVNTTFHSLGRDKIQVGLMMFSTKVVLNIPFNKYDNPEDFENALTNLTYVRGLTHLGNALRYVRTNLLKAGNGYRATVPHVVIVLTDGWATDEPLARKEIKLLKKEQNLFTLLVGIGRSVNKAALLRLTGSPKDVVYVESWTGLKTKVPALKKRSCVEIQRIRRCHQKYKADVIFLVDSSTSLGLENFNEIKDFMLNVTEAFKVIGKNGIRVALLQFSSWQRTKIIFNLGDHDDRKSLVKAMKDLKYTKGDTKTGYALYLAWKKMLPKVRKGVTATLVVLTDGKATDNVKSIVKKLHKLNDTAMLAVGIGKPGVIDVDELKLMASEPKEVHVFHPNDFKELPHYLKYVVTGVCSEAEVKSKQQKKEKEDEEKKKKAKKAPQKAKKTKTV